MHAEPSSTDVARWKRLLHVPDTTTDELYDVAQGVRPVILRSFGFHDEYLSYASSTTTRRRKRLKGEGYNWASVSRVSRAIRGIDEVKLLTWTYSAFKNQLRHGADTTASLNPFATHARGVFIDKSNRRFVVYEPRRYNQEICQWFGSCLNEFAKDYKSYTRLLLYGNQTTTADCEKRVLRFGMCCWTKFIASGLTKPSTECSCGLEITHIDTFYIRN